MARLYNLVPVGSGHAWNFKPVTRNVERGRLILLVGPPASGKSYLARLLVERLEAVSIQTDLLRKARFRPPRYTARENAAVYAEAHRQIARHLKAGRAVVFDATNLRESNRRTVYRLAEQARASLLIAMTYASSEDVLQRLAGREAGLDPADRSDADWEVHRKLQRCDPIPRPHLLVNTACDLEQAVGLVAARLEVSFAPDTAPSR